MTTKGQMKPTFKVSFMLSHGRPTTGRTTKAMPPNIWLYPVFQQFLQKKLKKSSRHSTEIAIFCPTFELTKTVCECFSLGGLKLDGQVAEVQVWVALSLTFECSSRRQSKASRSLWKAVLPGPRSGAIGVKCETQDDSESVTVLPGRDRLGSPKQCYLEQHV